MQKLNFEKQNKRKNKIKMQSTRRVIRIKVLQALYAYEIEKNTSEASKSKEYIDTLKVYYPAEAVNDAVKKIKIDILSDLEEKEKYKFASDLMDRVLENVDKLDDTIKEKIENWEFERIALIDKLVLRMGLAELLYFPEIPPKVSINEAIEIAKSFCTNQSGKFVNGILDSILNDLKKNNTLEKHGRGLLDIKKK